MKRIISDRHIVVALFVLVFVTFSFAHEDSKDLEQLPSGFKLTPTAEKTVSVSSAPSVNQPASQEKKSFTQATSLR